METDSPNNEVDHSDRTPLMWILRKCLQEKGCIDNVSAMTVLAKLLSRRVSLFIGPKRSFIVPLGRFKKAPEKKNKILFFALRYPMLLPKKTSDVSLFNSVFLRLLLCSAGYTDSGFILNTLKAINEEVAEPSNTLDVAKAVLVLCCADPAQFLPSNWLQTDDTFSDPQVRMAIKGANDKCVNLEKLSAACVRSCLRSRYPGVSILPYIHVLKHHLPKAMIEILCLGIPFSGGCDLAHRKLHSNMATSPAIEMESSNSDNSGQLLVESDNNCPVIPDNTNDISLWNLFDCPNIPQNILKAMLPLGRDCLFPPANSEQIISVPERFEDISRQIDTSTVYSHLIRSFSERIDRFIQSVVNVALKGYEFKVVRCGSTVNGLKIGSPDEFDYMIKLTSLYLPNAHQLNSGELRMTCTCHNNSPDSVCDFKRQLCLRLSTVLLDLFSPEKPRTGQVYVENLYLHTRAPGVCVKLAWLCPQSPLSECHKHVVSIDITPSISATGELMENVWSPPNHFNRRDLKRLFKSINNLVPDYVGDGTCIQDTQTPPTAVWQLSFNSCNPLLYQFLGRISSGFKHVMRVLKLMRDLALPKVLKMTSSEESRFVFKHKQGDVISSHTLQQLMMMEFLEKPKRKHWNPLNLPVRIINILSGLKQRELSSFYTGKPESILQVPTRHRTGLKAWMDRDVDILMDSVTRMSGENDFVLNNYYDDVILNTLDVFVIPKGCDKPLVKVDINEMLVEPGNLCDKLGLDRDENLYYYQIPQHKHLSNSPFIQLLVGQVTAKLTKSLGRSSVVGRKRPSSDTCMSDTNGSPLTKLTKKYHRFYLDGHNRHMRIDRSVQLRPESQTPAFVLA